MAAFIHIFATIETKPEFFEMAKAAIANIVPLTLQETGCHSFSLFSSLSEPNTLHLYETFDSQEALDYHYAREYTRAVFDAYSEWLERPLIVQKLTLVAIRQERNSE